MHLRHRVQNRLDLRLLVFLRPVVQPPRVELRVLQRPHRLVLPHHRQLAVRVAGAEVHRGVRLSGQTAARHHLVGRAIGREGHVGRVRTEVLHGQVVQLLQVGLVAGRVAAILVLNLHHDDPAPVRDHVGSQDRQQLVVPRGDGLHILGVAGSDLDIVLLEQPVGKASELPLGADVGPRTHDD